MANTMRVRGRVRREIGGRVVVFELSEGGLSIRQLYSRRVHRMSLSEMWCTAIGQKLLPLELPAMEKASGI
jgi:hypothetical protein